MKHDLQFWALGVLFLLLVTACNTTGNEKPDDRIENAPFYYTLMGELSADVSIDEFTLRSEWAKPDVETLNEVQAGFFALQEYTANETNYSHRFIITIVKHNNWPDEGVYSVADIKSVRSGNSNDFFVNLKSLYREQSEEEGNDERFYLEDYIFHATGGNIEITTSNSETLRGNFTLSFDLNEKRTWDGISETISGPDPNSLTINGKFDMDLTTTKVAILSQF